MNYNFEKLPNQFTIQIVEYLQGSFSVRLEVQGMKDYKEAKLFADTLADWLKNQGGGYVHIQ